MMVLDKELTQQQMRITCIRDGIQGNGPAANLVLDLIGRALQDSKKAIKSGDILAKQRCYKRMKKI